MSGGIAGRGRPGPAGPAGPMGPTGPQGDPAFTLSIGDVSAVPYGQAPEVVNSGTTQDQVWDLKLVTGATGVLTGSVPPTATDGTSLGQLYYCTSNQTYYSLVELNENNNKWRPLMTQDVAIREYHLDIIAQGDYGLEGATYGVIGIVDVKMDDVQKQMTVSQHFVADLPIGQNANQGWTLLCDARVHSKLRADAASCGINAVPVIVYEAVNSVTTQVTWDLLGELSYAQLFSISANYAAGANTKLEALRPTPGDGSNPGVRFGYEEGRLVYTANENGAPASTSFGNAPGASRGVNTDDLSAVLVYRPKTDTTYPKTLRCLAIEVIPYA